MLSGFISILGARYRKVRVFSFCSCVNISEALALLTGTASINYIIIKIIISGIVTVATFSLSVTYMNQFPIPQEEEITEVDEQ